jgi:hypothetical protein
MLVLSLIAPMVSPRHAPTNLSVAFVREITALMRISWRDTKRAAWRK